MYGRKQGGALTHFILDADVDYFGGWTNDAWYGMVWHVGEYYSYMYLGFWYIVKWGGRFANENDLMCQTQGSSRKMPRVISGRNTDFRI